MSAPNLAIIIGIALGVLFGALIILWRRQYRDLFAVFLVVSILALAVVVTIYQVDQYWAQRAEQAQIAQSQPASPPPSGSSMEAPAKPPIGVPILPPMVRGPSGAAAPPAVHSPYAGNP